MTEKCAVVVPWHRQEEIDSFLKAWKVAAIPEWLLLQQDVSRVGCGATKNAGILHAMKRGFDITVVLDGDCYPSDEAPSLEVLIEKHRQALQPQSVELFQVVTDPPSRGTPYRELSVEMPVACSLGFWVQVPDYCAVRQLAFHAKPMEFCRVPIFDRYFALCGMNMAFRPNEWWPWCQLIEIDRFDDIWMGWLWQKEAYRRGFCFNMNGPIITHARQSNVWKNLQSEAQWLEKSEVLWKEIFLSKEANYIELRKILPC